VHCELWHDAQVATVDVLCTKVSMLPGSGLVWGRAAAAAVPDAAVMTAGAYGVTPTAAPAPEPLVYCYNPAAVAGSDAQLPASLTYHHQLQQQMLLAAKSLQQQASQQMYVSLLPAASSLTGANADPSLALTPNLPFLSPDQMYLPPAAAAAFTPTGVALTSARKVQRYCNLDCYLAVLFIRRLSRLFAQCRCPSRVGHGSIFADPIQSNSPTHGSNPIHKVA